MDPLCRLTYLLEAARERDRRTGLPLQLIRELHVFPLSTIDHLAVFLECTLTRRPGLTIRCFSHLSPEAFADAYPGWSRLRREHDVRFADDRSPGRRADAAVMLYSFKAHPAGSAASKLRRAFTRRPARMRYIIHGDGTIWDAHWLKRMKRRLLRPWIRRLRPMRDRREWARIESSMIDDPGVDPSPCSESRPPRYRLLLSAPVRIEQDPATGNCFKPGLYDGQTDDLYEEGYHVLEYVDTRKDWPGLAQYYQDRRWANMAKVGVNPPGKVPSHVDAPPRALDYGCGMGLLAARLAEEGFDVLGSDIAHATIAQARRNVPHIRFVVADLDALLARGERFDLVTLSHLLEHLREDVEFLDQLKGLLTTQGRVYIEVPWFERRAIRHRPDWHRQRDHIREYTKCGLDRAVRQAGYHVLAHADSFEDPGREPYQFLLAQPRCASSRHV